MKIKAKCFSTLLCLLHCFDLFSLPSCIAGELKLNSGKKKMGTCIKICPPKPCHSCATQKKTVLNMYLCSQVCYSGELHPNSYHHAQFGVYPLIIINYWSLLIKCEGSMLAPYTVTVVKSRDIELFGLSLWCLVICLFVSCCLFGFWFCVCVVVFLSSLWILVYPSIVTTMFIFVYPQKQLKPSICGAWGCVSNEWARCCRLAHFLFLLFYFA